MNSIGRIIKKEEMNTSEWSGGTTTQILIYPENANYKNREFIWRLSSARVETEESEFTQLPGVHRIIMILEGELSLVHQQHYSKKLSEYETDEFEGEWITKSRGKVTDFNLMTKGNAKGSLTSIQIQGQNNFIHINEVERKDNDYKNHSFFYYCPETGISIKIGTEEYVLNTGDLLFISNVQEIDSIELINKENKSITIVNGRIYY